MTGWVGNEWKPDVETARAQFHTEYDGWYGENYERLKELLDDLVAAVRRDAAAEIREYVGPESYPHETPNVRTLVASMRAMADLIDPEVD